MTRKCRSRSSRTTRFVSVSDGLSRESRTTWSRLVLPEVRTRLFMIFGARYLEANVEVPMDRWTYKQTRFCSVL